MTDFLQAKANEGGGTDQLAVETVAGGIMPITKIHTGALGADAGPVSEANPFPIGISQASPGVTNGIQINALTYPNSTGNNSTVQLAAAAVFTGTVETILSMQAAQIMVRCDQPFTLTVYQYIDAAGLQQCGSPVVFTRAANVGLNENVTLPGNYFKLTLQNTGASITTNLVLATTFGIMDTQPQALGQTAMAGSFPVALATEHTDMSSLVAYNVAGVIALNTDIVVIDCLKLRSISVQALAIGTSGQITVQWANDAAFTTPLIYVGWTPLNGQTSNGIFSITGVQVFNVYARYCRLRVTVATTAGSTTFNVFGSTTPFVPLVAQQVITGTTTVAGYPTAAASADALANPTVTKVDATSLLFNGTTWDRMRNNVNVLTGDTGAKVATFNGATQTNFNARGASILINMGAVTGTTPTLTAQMQMSLDSGTTWVNVTGAVTPTITATGTTLLTVYPGATVAANSAISFPMPRTWRLVYTIGGTAPSFTITNVQVAYTL